MLKKKNEKFILVCLLAFSWSKLSAANIDSTTDLNSKLNEDALANSKTNTEQTEKLPKFEIGMGGAAANSFDYPAADQQHFHFLPFPYFIYRGSIFKSDRDRGTRAEFISDDYQTFDLSFGGSFPSPKDSNLARAGMSSLDWLGEVGPRYNVRLWSQQKGKESTSSLRAQISWRAVFATDFSRVKDQGNLLQPQLSYQTYLADQIRLFSKLGVIFADERLASYFYEVQDKDVTEFRPRYQARPGFLGTSLDVGLTYFWSKSLRIILSQDFSFFSGSANQGSPLFRKSENQSTLLAFIWVFHVVEQGSD